MSNEAIAPSTFIREYTRELHNKNAAVFAGAGKVAARRNNEKLRITNYELRSIMGLDAEHPKICAGTLIVIRNS